MNSISGFAMPAKRMVAIITSVLVAGTAPGSDFLTEDPQVTVDVSRTDGRLLMALDGDVWLLDAHGGEARRLIESNENLSFPKWSPDSKSVLYISEFGDGAALRVRELGGAESRPLGNTDFDKKDASWHPNGERVVYASDQHDHGLDFWETGLPTGLSWRLTSSLSDELSPAWSSNGRHLACITREDDHYSIMLRLHGEPETALLHSTVSLSSLTWRPDGSLLTYLRHGNDETTLEMAILSNPVLVRTMIEGEKFIPSPIAWRDRFRLLYTADGQIRSRNFEDRVSRPVHFRAMVRSLAISPPPTEIPQRELTVDTPPERH